MNTFKKSIAVIMTLIIAFVSVGANSSFALMTGTVQKVEAKSSKGKILVAYFSRAGGNYGVGNVQK